MVQAGKVIEYPCINSRDIIEKYDIELSLGKFIEEICIYNERTNLVSRETSRDDLIRIAADCLIPFEFFNLPQGSLFDIGSGAGFPPIVLALAFPGLEITAIERKAKKCGFIRLMSEKLDLNINVINEDFINSRSFFGSGSFDFGTMKLVKLDKEILKNALGYLKPGGCFIYYSSPDSPDMEMPDYVTVRTEYYYLDDSKHLRAVSYFIV